MGHEFFIPEEDAIKLLDSGFSDDELIAYDTAMRQESQGFENAKNDPMSTFGKGFGEGVASTVSVPGIAGFAAAPTIAKTASRFIPGVPGKIAGAFLTQGLVGAGADAYQNNKGIGESIYDSFSSPSRAIDTGLGIAGGVAGTYAGGALGSLAGPVGTVVGAGVGNYLGETLGNSVVPAYNWMVGDSTTPETVRQIGQAAGSNLAGNVIQGGINKGVSVLKKAPSIPVPDSVDKFASKFFPSDEYNEYSKQQVGGLDPYETRFENAIGKQPDTSARSLSEGMQTFSADGKKKTLTDVTNKYGLLKAPTGREIGENPTESAFQDLQTVIKNTDEAQSLNRAQWSELLDTVDATSVPSVGRNDAPKTIGLLTSALDGEASPINAISEKAKIARNVLNSIDNDLAPKDPAQLQEAYSQAGVGDEAKGLVSDPYFNEKRKEIDESFNISREGSLKNSIDTLKELYAEKRRLGGFDTRKMSMSPEDLSSLQNQKTENDLRIAYYREAIGSKLKQVGGEELFKEYDDLQTDYGALTELEFSLTKFAAGQNEILNTKSTGRALQNNNKTMPSSAFGSGGLANKTLALAGSLLPEGDSLAGNSRAANQQVSNSLQEMRKAAIARNVRQKAPMSTGRPGIDGFEIRPPDPSIFTGRRSDLGSPAIGAGIGAAAGSAVGMPLLGAGLGGLAGSNFPLKRVPYDALFNPNSTNPITTGLREGSLQDEQYPQPTYSPVEAPVNPVAVPPDKGVFAPGPESVNTIVSGLVGDGRNFERGLPRNSNMWDDKAMVSFVAIANAQSPEIGKIANDLVKRYQEAVATNDTTLKRQMISNMAQLVPTAFEPGKGIDGYLYSTKEKADYMAELENAKRFGTVGSVLLARQTEEFANPKGGKMLPYTPPITKGTRQRVLGQSRKNIGDYN